MTKKSISLLIILCISLCAFLPSCSDSGESTSSSASSDTLQYTVQIKTVGGMPLEDVGVRVYDLNDSNDLVWAGETDENGVVNFSIKPSNDYTAVLQNVPDGYKNEESYALVSEDSIISLETVLADAGDLTGYTYQLGSIIRDFSVADVNGKSYKISELLEEKKAVVLNFWFLNCGPCKMEFPYLQAAYEAYEDKIAVLALNPLDGTDESISDYASQLGITFPMSACDMQWQNCMRLTAYPTTVVIDRYGMIAMMHKGSITESGVFESIFEYFVSDNYKQTTIRNISDID